MEVAFAVLADAANKTENGKLNLLGAFSTVISPKYPAAHLGAKLVIRFVYTALEKDDEHEIKIELIDPEATVVQTKKGKIHLGHGQGARSFFDVIEDLTPMIFNKPGNYEIRVSVDGELAETAPIAVVNPMPSPQENK